jgi:hypothetical protein
LLDKFQDQERQNLYRMKKENELGLIVSYYLSRFGDSGCRAIGYKNFTQATQSIGNILGIKPNTLKNMRDEFDPYHENLRAGWYQRELRESRKKVMLSFQDQDEATIRQLVSEIIYNEEFINSPICEKLLDLFSDTDGKYKKTAIFVSRGITGKKAEEIFMNHFRQNSKPIIGTLIDKRDSGMGYDFEIKSKGETYFVEVKGLAGKAGGISFTNKEWEKAQYEKEKYFVVLVRKVKSDWEIKFFSDPTSLFHPSKQIYLTTNIFWNVASKDLYKVK